jgi:hypothetical protein
LPLTIGLTIHFVSLVVNIFKIYENLSEIICVAIGIYADICFMQQDTLSNSWRWILGSLFCITTFLFISEIVRQNS